MKQCSTGALVPAVKPEPKESSIGDLADPSSGNMGCPVHEKGLAEVDRDLLCPICMQVVKNVFLTACGHSFCYICIKTHLSNKSDCPCCAQFLSTNQLFPNFLLDKLLKKTSARQISRSASPVEHFRQALQQGVSIKELNTLLALLAEKKRKMEQEEAKRNMQILLDFLNCLRKQKVDELNEVQTHLQFIKEGIGAVERRRMELYRARDKYSVKLRMLGADDSIYGARKQWLSSTDNNTSALSRQEEMSSWNLPRKDASDSQYMNSNWSCHSQKKAGPCAECYLQKRHQMVNQPYSQQEQGKGVIQREDYTAGLADFQTVLTTLTRYSRMGVIAELRHGDLFHSANILSSIEFDCDYELFGTAGVSRCIKVFDFSSLLELEQFTKNHIASTDYEGIIIVWDANTRQSFMEYEEHEKRAWSVDFSCTEPTRLVSGSDDCKVKLLCTSQEASVIDIDMKANICFVKYNLGSGNCIAVGSADHDIHYYDLRNPSEPLHVFTGHGKAVSYVKFLSNYELASASTDSTLRLWNVRDNIPVRTFKGHTNEKNFVGLTVNSKYIACGSETNEVFVYHKEISKPMTWHKFGSLDLDDADDDAGDSPTMLTANSQGTIKVLILAA
ncbi:E3 ubiquitin-protein ligase COP1-like [Pyrus ussuriensis x Pyrus communis]|uniref:E3 ubiquitin-protein ligase COP1-like n=1 Tax=Pyrus ussuriensis x Pyrus communis TaxID=2448454 RepID=A0A5N5I1J6_9ROSA|nr:E3 ubiquitin-protein ligase COP1-like [Pyrus ussuriensis x Pyrus communis]